MSQPTWTIEFHRTDNGKCQVIEDFFPSLTPQDQVRVRALLRKVEQHGPEYDDFSKPLEGDILELRFTIQAGIVRLFYFYRPNYTIVITHGICKKKQKTDRADIVLAIRYMQEYLARSRKR